MDKEKLREIIYILVAIVVSILAVKLFIWLLPFILIIIIAGFIYNSMKKHKVSDIDNNAEKKSKKIIIIDEESEK